jgi:cytochrome c oxidase cbb3-type subunit 3
MLLLAACERAPVPPAGVAEAPPASAERLLVQAGAFEAGSPAERAPARNPLADDPNAANDGRRLYAWMNCAGCHGVLGGGGIGPPLRDAEWIYGNDAASLFQTVAQGRPNGMPAFGAKLPDEQIWRIVAYVESLDAAKAEVRHGGSSGESPTEMQQKRAGR